ncbi:hypothetical protein GCM10011613_31720 [Cellvibrio zantedeschiae]|uniref:histidine kinase n=1 Tax=Cellvibrio zantedeschiae TaxID=1237077 RepID=A0ABQ3B8T2_9GAMM|nr:ATP-binding protein [Cellvibrio zantedeschiae]GGY84447.1 hypothetical protein GCM10011613_31720 [Cellvibrio zantedeschiae]
MTEHDLRWLQRFTSALGLCTLIAGVISFSGWALDIPRLTDWLNDGISIQPNTTVLIALAGAAVLLLQYEYFKSTILLGGFVAFIGALNLLQYMVDADFGFNHQLLFGREWGRAATMAPGRFGPPASISFVIIGISLALLGARKNNLCRLVPGLALFVVLLMMFSLLGYMFGARNFYAIPWLSAISLPSAAMLMTLAVSLIMSAPQHQPMLLLIERSSAGAMARKVLPILILMIPLLIWLRVKGYELGLFDLGTSRALGAAALMCGSVLLMWKALQDLRRQEQREREADKRKDEFIATLAHELRNPLAPIGNAASMLKFAQSKPEVLGQATNIIERQLSHLVRLVDELLDVSRISQGKIELSRERIELSSVVQQSLEICKPLAEAASHKITVNLPSQPIYLNADPVRLSQVLSNLLVNACKFTNKNGHISLDVHTNNRSLTITVEDNGIGIPPTMLKTIFEIFSQVDQSLERSRSGLGIGLTLTKRLVELHGGNIEAFSEGLGKGSEFIVRLPIVIDEAPTLAASKNVEKPTAKKRILIADDNVDSANTLAEFLRLMGNEIFVVHDGEQAVVVANAQRPDAILLDIGMPNLNGFETCQQIRKHPWAENILIIALTGWGQDEDRRKSAQAGFNEHFVKPVDLTKLMELLATPVATKD